MLDISAKGVHCTSCDLEIYLAGMFGGRALVSDQMNTSLFTILWWSTK